MSSPKPTLGDKTIELEIEGLRGLAALMVLYTHLLAPTPYVDLHYTPSPRWYDFEAGQGAVLLFFVLSGYVIGLTNPGPFSAAAGGKYLLRRFVRLVPLCWVAILLSAAVLPRDSWGTILGNLLFVQNSLPYGNLRAPLLEANTNLWSLNYEAVYYLLFLVLWARPVNLAGPFALAGVLLALGLTLPGFPPFLTNYAAGWMFWLGGLWLASTPRAATDDVRWPWPSLLLFGLVSWKIKPLFFLTRRIGLTSPINEGWVNITFVDFIPVCVALVMIAALRRPRQAWSLVYLAAAMPVAFMIWRMVRGRFLVDEFAIYDGLVLAGIALWWLRPPLQLFRFVAPLGAISYGIYIFQRPAQWIITYADWLPSGNPGAFWLRVVIISALTLGLAWVAEKKLQPLIRRAFLGARPSPNP